MISLRSFTILISLSLLSFNLFGQFIQTAQNGDWNNTATWLGGVVPDIDTESINIDHTVTITNSVTVNRVVVSTSGTVTIAAGGVLTIPNVPNAILVEGTVQANEGSQIIGANGSNISFVHGSNYIHNFSTSEGAIPLANWESNSTIRIQGYTAAIGFISPTWGQSFGNFVWECAFQTGIINLNGLLNNEIQGSMHIEDTGPSFLRLSSGETFGLTIGGDLEIRNTARLQLTLSGQATINVGGDFNFESTAANGSRMNTTGQASITVAGDFSMDAVGGVLSLGDGAGSGLGTLRAGGNFSLINGTINESGSGTTRGRIEFVGNGRFDFINQGSLTGSLQYYIGAGTDINLSTYKLIGNIDSSLEVDGTIRVGATDPQGTIVAASGVGPGNIRVAARVFNSGSRVVYNGASAQIIGNGHPTEDGVDMVVQNPGGVYFNNASSFSTLRIGGTLFLESGNFFIDSNPSARSLRLSGPLDANGHQLIFTGNQCDLTIDGSGVFGLAPVSGDQTFRNLTVNRIDENVMFDQNVTVTGTVSVGGGSLVFNENIGVNQLTMTGGELKLNQNTTITGASSISGGILSFENRVLTVQNQLDVSGGFLKSNENSDLIFNGTGLIGNLSFTPESWLRSLYLERLLGGVLATIDYIRVTETVNLANGHLQNNGVFELVEGATITTSNISGVTGIPLSGGPYHVVYIGTANISPTGAELPAGEPIASLTVQTTNSGSVQVASDVEVVGDITVLSGGINFSGQSVTCANVQNEGTFVSGSGLLQVSGTVFNNGTFHAPTSEGLFRLVGNFENNGSFSQVGGTIEFMGSSHFNGNAPDFRNIIITGEFFAPLVFSVRGNFTNNGNFHTQNSSVDFSGTTQAPQQISGNSLSTFHNVRINNVVAKPGVLVQSDIHISGTLSLSENVEFDADGSSNTAVLTLLSSADNPTQDAAIDIIPASATISGDITVQRYMSIEGATNGRIYRYLSSPISNATVQDLQNEIPITGNFTGSSTCTGCSTTPSMFLYDESIVSDVDGSGSTNLNDGYQSFPFLDNTEQLDPGRGYAVFVRGNILSTPVWDVRGEVNRGQIEFPVTFTSSGNLDDDGWNLVGNPYPSAIDFNSASGWMKTNIDAAIYFRDNGSTPERFASWNGEVGTNGGTGIIPTGQGFWVKASGANPELRANENVKAPGLSSEFFRKEDVKNLLRIHLDMMDETVVYFREHASKDFDPDFDAHKLKNASTNIASYVDIEKPLAINAMPPFQCEEVIKLLVTEIQEGNHFLGFEGLESFPPEIAIFLQDAFTGDKINLKENAHVAFATDNNPMSTAVDRFSLHFTTQLMSPVISVKAPVICETEPANFNVSGNPDDVYSIFREDGLVVKHFVGNGFQEVSIASPFLQVGINRFSLSVSKPSCGSTLEIPFEITVAPTPVIDTVLDGSSCLPGEVVLSADFSGDFLRWYDCGQCETPIHESTSEFNIELEASSFFYVEPVSNAGCVGNRRMVVATVFDFDPVVIKEVGDSLVSSYENNNEWFYKGEPIGNSHFIIPTRSGEYFLQVQVGACVTSGSIYFEEKQKGKNFSVYPNPASDHLTIAQKQGKGPFKIVLLDIVGKEVLYGEGGEAIYLDLTHLSSGYYWLKIISSDFIEGHIIQKKF